MLDGVRHAVPPLFAALVLLAPLLFGLEAVAAVMVMCVVARTCASRSNGEGEPGR